MTTLSSTVQEKEKKVNQEILTIRMFSLLSIFIVSEKVTQENFFSPLKEKWNGKQIGSDQSSR